MKLWRVTFETRDFKHTANAIVLAEHAEAAIIKVRQSIDRTHTKIIGTVFAEEITTGGVVYLDLGECC